MRERDMVSVARIVVGQFPVALVSEPICLADEHLAARIAVQPFVDWLLDRTEMPQQRWRGHVERAKNEAAVRVDPRHLGEIILVVADQLAGKAVRPRYATELAGVGEIPAMIGALKRAAVALFPAADRGAAVGAAIVESTDPALLVAGDQ